MRGRIQAVLSTACTSSEELAEGRTSLWLSTREGAHDQVHYPSHNMLESGVSSIADTSQPLQRYLTDIHSATAAHPHGVLLSGPSMTGRPTPRLRPKRAPLLGATGNRRPQKEAACFRENKPNSQMYLSKTCKYSPRTLIPPSELTKYCCKALGQLDFPAARCASGRRGPAVINCASLVFQSSWLMVIFVPDIPSRSAAKGPPMKPMRTGILAWAATGSLSLPDRGSPKSTRRKWTPPEGVSPGPHSHPTISGTS